jgi:regulatory protein
MDENDPARAAYGEAVKMLSRRELSGWQLRERLKRAHTADAVASAVERLREEGAIDDYRVAVARARTESIVRHRGPLRVLRQLESMGISRDIARRAIADVLCELDETALLEEALIQRLRRGRAHLQDESQFRRIYEYLVRQGFDPSKVFSVLEARCKIELEPESQQVATKPRA